MEVMNNANFLQNNPDANTLFSYLDKGIDDMEAGKLHTVEEALQIVKEKMENAL